MLKAFASHLELSNHSYAAHAVRPYASFQRLQSESFEESREDYTSSS
jgi:hypothetical protein